MTSQSRPEGGLGRLAVHLLDEAARRLRERVAAALELRGADGAGTGAAGALLAPRLRAAPGDQPAALRRERAGALGVLLRADGLVHEVRLHVGAEHGLLERDVARALAASVQDRSSRSGHYPRTSTIAFFGPGTAPLTSRRLFSASTS